MNQRNIVHEFDQLSREQQGGMLDLLWERYAQREAARSLTHVERAEVERRLAAHRSDPTKSPPADEVHSELRAMLGDELLVHASCEA